jgi:hypothetical protein
MVRPTAHALRVRWLPALGAAAAVLLALADDAGAPPAIGVPNIAVTRDCVPFGGAITVYGYGFAPGTPVTVSSPEGHYTGPPLPWQTIAPITATADPSGAVKVLLRAPRPGKGESKHFQTHVIDGTGKAGSGDGNGESYDPMVVASHTTCRALAREK